MTRSVTVPARVRRELYRTARSIAAKVSTRSGELWLARIEAAFQKLANDAERWPEAEEAGLFGLVLRCCLVGRRPHVYRILFRYNDATVEIVKVRHAAQDYLNEDDF